LLQDATFIYAEPVHGKKGTPREDNVKTRRDIDGKVIKKIEKSTMYLNFIPF